MHDSFNLAWKINLLSRGLAKPSILHTYEEERQKIAYDLINFDVEHCKAFSEGESALSKNFDANIRFISGVGAEYGPGMLTAGSASTGRLQPGMLQLPAKVTRYIDANPVDIQLDIPLLGQFKIYTFVPDIARSMGFLQGITQELKSAFAKITTQAEQSYVKQPRGYAPSDEFVQSHRYTAVSEAFTLAMVTRSPQSAFEIADLPELLQKSRWTLYLDNAEKDACTQKWFGELQADKAGIAIIRPDGYVGAIDSWGAGEGELAGQWVKQYFSFML
jgi:hypothetical protein